MSGPGTARAQSAARARDAQRDKLRREARGRLGPGASDEDVEAAARAVMEDQLAQMRISSADSRRAVKRARATTARIDAARAEIVKAIVDAAPILTAEQREMLRPILVGSVPARSDGAA